MSKYTTHLKMALYLVFAATFLIYSVGLTGPFLFDDNFNLAPLKPWLAGEIGWQEAVFGNISGPLGRPVSMASFLFSAWAGGSYAYHFKLGNLLVHLACGVLCFALLRRLMSRDSRLQHWAWPAAAAATTVWLIHPLHVSTVLYVVQRMAQLSTLFVLASLLAYVAGRVRLERGARAPAIAWLFLAMPALWLLGLLSKENAAVASALCLVIEVAYFSRNQATRRVLTGFYSLTLALPALGALAVLLLRPDLLLAGYEIRDFDMLERLLSQSRALMSYLGMLLFPRSAELGLYTDGFAASAGLLSPITTLLSILALIAVSGIVIVLRRTSPSLFAGWFFFLAAHAVESSILPLELYYEHRNYLPAIGLTLALAGLLSLLPIELRSNKRFHGAIGVALLAGATALGSVTYQQARVWRDKEAIIEHAVANQPSSVRAVQAKAILAINKGLYDHASDLLLPLAKSGDRRTRSLAHLDLISISCLRGSGTDPKWLDQAVADARPKLTIAEIQAVGLLVQATNKGRCASLGQRRVADTIAAIADKATSQSDDILPKWQLRYAAALVYSRAEHWSEALGQAQLAWQPPSTPEVGGLLARALAHNGRQQEAERLLSDLQLRIDSRDKRSQAMLDATRSAISPNANRQPHPR
ncbi:putative membrane protein [Lysobacter antibioticus]|uniref:Tetratricopeptide repeat family protein n=1 Tax=Lysobacter antibioticus TaxID=84531 RepID=A0A0S2F745_LYSAN|nr:hypothetical protein [Lysobacter antibioticus]ALN62879.1 putative membrane protein [Lysobacter antibioticus]ALN79354.1 hypothetical protein LA76x_1195 [Lysobacter antibioticus]